MLFDRCAIAASPFSRSLSAPTGRRRWLTNRENGGISCLAPPPQLWSAGGRLISHSRPSPFGGPLLCRRYRHAPRRIDGNRGAGSGFAFPPRKPHERRRFISLYRYRGRIRYDRPRPEPKQPPRGQCRNHFGGLARDFRNRHARARAAARHIGFARQLHSRQSCGRRPAVSRRFPAAAFPCPSPCAKHPWI